jgi:stage II sporulation protein D
MLVTSLTGGARDAQAADNSALVIRGRGLGHGVGMSQWGAAGLAQHERSYEQILAHYYPATRLETRSNTFVRVLLGSGRRALAVGAAAPIRIVDSRGVDLLLPPRTLMLHGDLRVPLGTRNATLTPPLRIAPTTKPLSFDAGTYHGRFEIHRAPGGLAVVNVVGVEQYLRGVVPAEMPAAWPSEALKAQAVAARSYALSMLKPRRLFDLYKDVRSQVYRGISAERLTSDAAIAATRHQVLTWNGAVAATFYHASSGGRTVAVADAWPGAAPVPYLVSVVDPYDGYARQHAWALRVPRQQLGRKLKLGRLARIQLSRGPSGRIASVTAFAADGGTRVISGVTFAHALGLQSTSFAIDWTAIGDAHPDPAAVDVPAAAAAPGLARAATLVRTPRSDGTAPAATLLLLVLLAVAIALVGRPHRGAIPGARHRELVALARYACAACVLVLGSILAGSNLSQPPAAAPTAGPSDDRQLPALATEQSRSNGRIAQASARAPGPGEVQRLTRNVVCATHSCAQLRGPRTGARGVAGTALIARGRSPRRHRHAAFSTCDELVDRRRA